jgi:hypothetical protein
MDRAEPSKIDFKAAETQAEGRMMRDERGHERRLATSVIVAIVAVIGRTMDAETVSSNGRREFGDSKSKVGYLDWSDAIGDR